MSHGDVCCLIDKKEIFPKRLQIIMQNLQGKPQTFLEMQQNFELWSSKKHGLQSETWKFIIIVFYIWITSTNANSKFHIQKIVESKRRF